MPFNMAMLGVGGRTFILSISAEDLSSTYNVEAEVASQFPTAAPTRAGDKIQLSILGVNVIAASSTGYAIDADGLHDNASLVINLTAGAFISGKGGIGGQGGSGGFFDATDLSIPGFPGKQGGTALRFGCETNIVGVGEISKGYGGGGGGGGGAISLPTAFGGGGGGGGASLEDGGIGGIGFAGNGSAGGTSTVSADGGGGTAGGAQAGSGGAGGDSLAPASAGNAGTKAGGAAGIDGNAIDSQGFTHTEAGGITVTGPIL